MRAEPKTVTAEADARERVEAVDELAHDAQHAPGVGVDEARVLLALQQALVGRAHALLGRPLGAHAADAAMLGHTVSSTRIVPARAAASTLPPESTTPMRSPGHRARHERGDRHGRRRLDQQLGRVPDERHRRARRVVVDERDAGAQLAQHRERALAHLHRARAVGDRRPARSRGARGDPRRASAARRARRPARRRRRASRARPAGTPARRPRAARRRRSASPRRPVPAPPRAARASRCPGRRSRSSRRTGARAPAPRAARDRARSPRGSSGRRPRRRPWRRSPAWPPSSPGWRRHS